MMRVVRYIYILAAAFLVLSLHSCRKEELEGDESDMFKRDICFALDGTTASTRSTEASQDHVLGFLGTDTLHMRAHSEPMSGVVTKGYVTTTANLSSFFVTAHLTTGEKYFENVKTQKGDDGFAHTGRYWPNRNLNFFAYSHMDDDLEFSVTADGGCSGSFSYTLPAPDLVNKDDAASQPDYVFAFAADCSYDNGNATPIEFRHAFSAICVKLGTMNTDGRVINHVRLRNAVSSGDCDINLNGEGTTTFTWSNQSGSKTYTQTIGKAVENGNIINDDGIIFMMVPHVLKDVELELSVTLHKGTAHEHEVIISRKLADYTSEWLPDKKYVYTLSTTEEVKVEITDQVTATVKSDVQITNKGVSPSYIRAAIVGFWVNNEGNIVGDWKDTDGTFEWGDDWASHWVKGDDGFYYHLDNLEAGQKTWPLFETYTLTTDSNIADSHLELYIATQAVIHYRVGEAWPGCPMDK